MKLIVCLIDEAFMMKSVPQIHKNALCNRFAYFFEKLMRLR